MAGDLRTRYPYLRKHYLASCQVTYKIGMKKGYTLIDDMREISRFFARRSKAFDMERRI